MRSSRCLIFSIVYFILSLRSNGQYPVRPYNDPPGWAVEHSGRSSMQAKVLSPEEQWIVFSTTEFSPVITGKKLSAKKS